MVPLQMVPLLETPAFGAGPAPVASPPVASGATASGSSHRPARKPRCDDCFFHQNMLCALPDKKPCPTFRRAHPDGLKPPQQLSFAFRQARPSEPFFFQPAGA
jgi:hypothetical protein